MVLAGNFRKIEIMKNAFYFIAGVLFVVLVSAGTVSIMTIKPAQPKSTVYLQKTSKEEVEKYLKQGYIIKIVAKGDEWYSATVVLEKY